jgi:hypothetical protein
LRFCFFAFFYAPFSARLLFSMRLFFPFLVPSLSFFLFLRAFSFFFPFLFSCCFFAFCFLLFAFLLFGFQVPFVLLLFFASFGF